MPIYIDHITIPARDKVASMRWMARLLGVEAGPVAEPFAIVQLDGCTLDYVDRDDPQMQHIALRLDDETFDATYRRMIDEGIEIFGQPQDPDDPGKGKIYYQPGGRGFYFKDPDGHMMEIKTERDDPRRSEGYDVGPFRPAS